jgi:hypothetical protein
MTATVTELPVQGVRSYVVHCRTGAEIATVHVWAASPSRALVASGLGSGSVHDAKFTACATCKQALAAAEAVNPPC